MAFNSIHTVSGLSWRLRHDDARSQLAIAQLSAPDGTVLDLFALSQDTPQLLRRIGSAPRDFADNRGDRIDAVVTRGGALALYTGTRE